STVAPLPPVAASVFRNAQPEAAFVGADACRECHTDQHGSWALTAHSRALAAVDPGSEPQPGRFVHPPSGRTYEVLVAGDQMRHRET
ncbi:multiheme c-type cytochrome, partial [Salmonella sp. SAL4431]|uniref:multiheme c-type cytochrome n=1 Tax=Salmonella sp. SAL4431 TaxID=3159886 RepID=UPI003979ED22